MASAAAIATGATGARAVLAARLRGRAARWLRVATAVLVLGALVLSGLAVSGSSDSDPRPPDRGQR